MAIENKMSNEDLVVYMENGQAMSVGYKVDNTLINDSPLVVMKGGAKGKPVFAIPAGLFSLHQKLQTTSASSGARSFEIQQQAEVMGEDLYSRLLELAAPRKGGSKKRRNTRKKRKTSKRTTRKKIYYI